MLQYFKKTFKVYPQTPESILKYPAGKRYYREFHAIRKSYIDLDAVKVVNRLQRFSHKAYVVGGSIRDILLNRKPKDFDLVTSAHPNEVQRIFKNSRVIGKRFKINHIIFGRNKVIEVSTARSIPSNRIMAKNKENLYLKKDNQFGNFKEDAARRDFTINGLFFDIRNEMIIDYTGGVEDIKNKIIRIIGDVNISLPEDPVRMLRALKFASLLSFEIDQNLLRGIRKHRKLIQKASIARLHEEMNKIFWTGSTFQIFSKLVEVGLFQTLFPQISKFIYPKFPGWDKAFHKTLLGQRLIIADKMISEHEDINTTIYYAILISDFVLESSSNIFENTNERSSSRYQFEKKIHDRIVKLSKETGLTRKEIERLTKIFASQGEFLKNIKNQKDQNKFKNHEHFLESFTFYKINARANQDDNAIQRAFSWEIGFRGKLTEAIHKKVVRTVHHQGEQIRESGSRHGRRVSSRQRDTSNVRNRPRRRYSPKRT